MTIRLPFISKLLSSEKTIRRGLMVTLAFVMTHLISYHQLPFTSEYQFPIIPFFIFVTYGIFICEINTWNYGRLSQKFGRQFSLGNSWRIVRTNLFACAIIFGVLTSIQMMVFQYVMNPFRFVGLLSVCLMISLIETGVFIVRGISKKKAPITLRKLAAESAELTILRNNELLRFDEKDIYYLIHQNGCVFLVDSKGNKFTTQFEALSDAELKLSNQFFRANRQTLISKKSIESLQNETNNKLKIKLSYLNEPLMVSRYKSRELKEWVKS
jgi:hypothetical protein